MIKNKNINLRVALIGNPNTGKTTLFNKLTGNAQYVGNWPGVTVEKKEGYIKNTNFPVKITDLPGVYSLSPFSPEEIITRNFILENNTDLIINIIDATNLERNLYLTTQILELGKPVIIALNMCDRLQSKGKIIDFCTLENLLGTPVVPISAAKNIGIEELTKKITNFDYNKKFKIFNYSKDVESKILKIKKILQDLNSNFYNNRFILVKVLESDALIISSLNLNFNIIKKIDEIRGLQNEIKYEEDIAAERYKKSSEICKKSISDINKIKKIKISRKIDKVITGKFAAIPIFLIIMLFIFYVSFGPIGTFCQSFAREIISKGIEYPLSILLNQLKINNIFSSFIFAIVAGMGEVLSFLPQILILFGMLALLEDSGYMARAAFIMDKLMRKIGLSGKAFVPLLMGFGCSVPAILSTRILNNEKEKKLTIFLIPFMSCGAKIPVYLVFLNAFFPEKKAIMMFLIYLTGILFAILMSFLFRKIVRPRESPMIMELPDYKIPSLHNLYLHLWDQSKDFLEHVGAIILGSSVVIWFLQSFDQSLRFVEDNSQSLLAKLGGFIAPIFTFSGFANWKSAVALITGLLSKEAIISTMSIVYGAEESNLNEAILQNFTKSSALAILVFILLYPPCISALAVFKKESDTFSACLSLVVNTLIALIASILVFNIVKF